MYTYETILRVIRRLRGGMGKEAEQEKLTNEQASKATKRNEDEQVTNNTEQAKKLRKPYLKAFPGHNCF